MFHVVTAHSIYTIVPVSGGFSVQRSADRYGRQVKDTHKHFTPEIFVKIGLPLTTSELDTTPVLAILA